MLMRTSWMWFVLALVPACADSVTVGDGTETLGRDEDNTLATLAHALQGEWHGTLMSPPLPPSSTSFSLPIVLKFGPASRPRAAACSIACASASPCPLSDISMIAAAFGADAQGDAGTPADLFSGELDLLGQLSTDAGVNADAVLLLGDSAAIRLSVWLGPDNNVLHITTPGDQVTEFTR